MQTSLRVAGAGPGPVVPMVAGAVPGGRNSVRAYACCCAVNLLGGDGGEAIAANDADLELGGSPDTASRLAVCLWSRDSLLGDHGAVVVDADLQGSEWKTSIGWFPFLLAGLMPEGGAVADVDLGGSALRNRQVRLAACFRHVTPDRWDWGHGG